ncbi:MauE/DoxX family redox-associated membrane protein [Devosia sp. XK-2]|uniref:MauE/DoxX family redox-associated membrane protein n=1 Tax=Devosia sp. XK-2 TaxID=3126689 RepID=UPI0030D2C3E7
MIEVNPASLVAAALTVFISLIFARAAWHKMGEFTEFTGFVADYRLLPEPLVIPVSYGIVAAEVVAVALQFIPAGRPFGLAIAVAMLLLYGYSMAVNIRRGRITIECGCGGAAQPLSWALVARNGLLAAFGLLATALPMGSLGPADAVAAIVSGFALWVAYLLIEQILSNASLARLTR